MDHLEMINSEVLLAILSAQKGDLSATRTLQRLTEPAENDTGCYLGYDASISILTNLTHFSERIRNDSVYEILYKSLGSCTCEEYAEYVRIFRFYGFTLLVKLVEKRWNRLSDESKDLCRRHCESLWSTTAVDSTPISEYNGLVLQKAAQYIAAVALADWPQGRWLEFLPFCLRSVALGLSKFGNDTLVDLQTIKELQLLLRAVNEISTKLSDCHDNRTLYKQRIQVVSVIKQNVYDLFVTIHRVIVMGLCHCSIDVESNAVVVLGAAAGANASASASANVNGDVTVSSRAGLSTPSSSPLSASDKAKRDFPMLHLVSEVFCALSSILDGVVFVEFEVDEFFLANLARLTFLDVVTCLSNTCASVAFKAPKCRIPTEVQISTDDKVYDLKLKRFLMNVIRMFSAVQASPTYDSCNSHLQMILAVKTLFDKNGVYIFEHCDTDTLKALFELVLNKAILHPCSEVAACGTSTITLALRRFSASTRNESNQNQNGLNDTIEWLDIPKLILALYIRSLRIGGNALVVHAQIDEFIAQYTGLAKWTETLVQYTKIEDDSSDCYQTQCTSLDAAFSGLRSAILSAASSIATLGMATMYRVSLVLVDILGHFMALLCSNECPSNSPCNLKCGDRHLSWSCMQLVLFDGICFIFEGCLTRVKSAAAVTPSDSPGKYPEWMLLTLRDSSNVPCQKVSNHAWVEGPMTLLASILQAPISSSHSSCLEIRRLELLGTCGFLFLYRSDHLLLVLESIVAKLIVPDSSGSVTRLHKVCMATLVSICRQCTSLVAQYVEPIVGKIQQVLVNAASTQQTRDLLLESLVSLTCCLDNIDTLRRISMEILSPYAKGIIDFAESIMAGASVTAEARASENLFIQLFTADPFATGFNVSELEDKRRNLRRVFIMAHSVIKKATLSSSGANAQTDCSRSIRAHPLQDSLSVLLPPTLSILSAVLGMWKPSFFERNPWKKTVLTPCLQEWISLQGSGAAAVTSEEELSILVDSVFGIPPAYDAKVVQKCRRHCFLLRQCALNLVGLIITQMGQYNQFSDIFTARSNQLAESVESALIMPLNWIQMSHLAQVLKLVLVPSAPHWSCMHARISNLLLKRLNNEYKALMKLGSKFVQEEHCGNAVALKTLHLYYLRLYACIDAGMLVLEYIERVLKGATVGDVSDEIIMAESVLTVDGGYDCKRLSGRNGVTNGDGNATATSRPTTSANACSAPIFESFQSLDAILKTCTMALEWPHVKTVVYAFRLLRMFAKMAPRMELAPEYKQHCADLTRDIAAHIHTLLDTRASNLFDPVALRRDSASKTEYQRFLSDSYNGNAASTSAAGATSGGGGGGTSAVSQGFGFEAISTIVTLHVAMVKLYNFKMPTGVASYSDKRLELDQVCQQLPNLVAWLQPTMLLFNRYNPPQSSIASYIQAILEGNVSQGKEIFKTNMSNVYTSVGAASNAGLAVLTSTSGEVSPASRSRANSATSESDDSQDALLSSDVLYLFLEQ